LEAKAEVTATLAGNLPASASLSVMTSKSRTFSLGMIFRTDVVTFDRISSHGGTFGHKKHVKKAFQLF
jgi:hypothetical protein